MRGEAQLKNICRQHTVVDGEGKRDDQWVREEGDEQNEGDKENCRMSEIKGRGLYRVMQTEGDKEMSGGCEIT